MGGVSALAREIAAHWETALLASVRQMVEAGVEPDEALEAVRLSIDVTGAELERVLVSLRSADGLPAPAR